MLRDFRQVRKELGSNESHIRLNLQVNCCVFFRLLSTNEKYLHTHRFESNKSSHIDHITHINRQNERGKRLTTLDLRLRPSIKEGAKCRSACFFAFCACFFCAKNKYGGISIPGKIMDSALLNVLFLIFTKFPSTTKILFPHIHSTAPSNLPIGSCTNDHRR